MTCRKVHVYAAATVANVACGFDILGFALSAPGDEVIAELSDTPGVRIRSVAGEAKVPLDPERNTAAVAAAAFLKQFGSSQGIDLELRKNMPLGSGLGSSAASAAAGVFAANLLIGSPLAESELVKFAMLGEEAACGAAHADNVAPALLGGFVLIRSYEPLDVVKIPAPPDLWCSVIHPHIELRTEDARKILRKDVPLKLAIKQWGNIAGLIAGLTTGNFGLIGRSLQDVIIEPERALLIPGFSSIKEGALNSGALGCSISGSGPSIFALAEDQTRAEKAGDAMRKVVTELGLKSDLYVSQINNTGPKILNKE